MKFFMAAAAFLQFLPLSVPTSACSLAGCIDRGVEMSPNFLLRVTHGDKPLAGVTIEITSNSGKGDRRFSSTTALDGTVRIVGLTSGDYWLNAQLLGITAGSECFHVDQHASRKAKRIMTYEWGDLAPATRSISGKLIESRPGTGGTSLWNLLHRVDVPISGAKIRLQGPLTAVVYSTISDQDGNFSFGRVPDGIYALHIEGETSMNTSAYESPDQLIRLSHTAKLARLLLESREAAAGSCGGWSLELG